jgi:hypothetical protein
MVRVNFALAALASMELNGLTVVFSQESTVLRSTLLSALVAVALLPPLAHSQALPTQQKAADLQVGGFFSYSIFSLPTPLPSAHFYGPGAFVDFDLRHHIGIEGSYNLLNNSSPSTFNVGTGANVYTLGGITQKTYQVGIRYRVTLPHGFADSGSRFVPWVRGTYGRGVFNYGYAEVPSNGTTFRAYNTDVAYNIYTLGGGLDFHLTRSINLRLVDFQHQVWLNFPTQNFTPDVLSVGAAYHFH